MTAISSVQDANISSHLENNPSCSLKRAQRVKYLDIAKGLLITLVVIGHAWRSVYDNGLLHNADIYHLVDSWIYAFHMPAFFFISGMFALHSAQQSVKKNIEKKLRTIAYPYLLWSVIQSVLQLVMSGSTTSTMTIEKILKIPYVPVMQFWFLYALFFVFLVFILIKQLTTSPIFIFGTGLLFFFLIRTGNTPDFLPIIFLANNFIYFAAGILCANFLLSETYSKMKTAHLLAFFVLFFFVNCLMPSAANKIQPTMRLWGAPFIAIPGVILTLLTASLLQQVSPVRLANAFSLLGRRSLEIFVTHTIFSAGFRIVAFKLAGINSLSFHLLGASLAGLVGPLILVYFAERIKFRYLFTWPSR